MENVTCILKLHLVWIFNFCRFFFSEVTILIFILFRCQCFFIFLFCSGHSVILIFFQSSKKENQQLFYIINSVTSHSIVGGWGGPLFCLCFFPTKCYTMSLLILITFSFQSRYWVCVSLVDRNDCFSASRKSVTHNSEVQARDGSKKKR